MTEDDTVTVYFQWEGVTPDPAQYKPYSPHFKPYAVAVALNVPKRFVLMEELVMDDDSPPFVVLSPDGMAWCSEQLSQGITHLRTGVVK